MKILIVEDEILIALELERIVAEAGHMVIGPVATLEQALAYAVQSELVLLDVRLADGHTGGAIGRRLMDRFGVKVIFVTANPDSIGYGLEGASGVIMKPFTDSDIISAIDHVLAEGRPNRSGPSETEGAMSVVSATSR